jgi:hypothetical protein
VPLHCGPLVLCTFDGNPRLTDWLDRKLAQQRPRPRPESNEGTGRVSLARLVAVDHGVGAGALLHRIATVTAWTGVHRPDQHEMPAIDPQSSRFRLCLSKKVGQTSHEQQLDVALFAISTPFRGVRSSVAGSPFALSSSRPRATPDASRMDQSRDRCVGARILAQ